MKSGKYGFDKNQIEALRLLYPDHKCEEVARIIGKSAGSVYAMAFKLGIKKSKTFLSGKSSGRFKAGNVPRNTGNRFKSGSGNEGFKPVGSHRTTKDGYIEVKVTDALPARQCWQYLHRVIWEKHHGPIPEGHVVAFKDRDKRNFEIENLALRTTVEQARLNNETPEYLREVVRVQKILKQRIKNHDKTHRRPAKDSV